MTRQGTGVPIPGPQPNVSFIMADDHTANVISAYGSRLASVFRTPHIDIDRLAEQDILLENCHCTNAICAPSRTTILTGQHSHINGGRTLADPALMTRIASSSISGSQLFDSAVRQARDGGRDGVIH